MVVGTEILTIGVGFAVLAAVALAVQSLAIRYGTINSPSSDALLVVLVVNVCLIVPLAFLRTNPLAELTPWGIIAFASAGLVGTMLGRALHYEGIKRVGMSRAEPIKASQPLHASIIAIIVLGEVVTAGHFFAMIAIVIGIGLITYEYSGRSSAAGEGRLAGLAFPLAAAVFYGIEPTFAKLGFDTGASVLAGLMVKTITALLGYSLYLSWRKGLPHPREFDVVEFPWLLFAGGANTLFLLAYYAALELEPVSLVVPLVQSSPLLVIVLAIVFVRSDLERVTWRTVVAACIVVAGAIGVTLLR